MGRPSKRNMDEAKLRSRDWAAYLVRDHGFDAETKLAEYLSEPGLSDLKRYQLKCTAKALAARRKRDRTRASSTALVVYNTPLFSLARIGRILGIGR